MRKSGVSGISAGHSSNLPSFPIVGRAGTCGRNLRICFPWSWRIFVSRSMPSHPPAKHNFCSLPRRCTKTAQDASLLTRRRQDPATMRDMIRLHIPKLPFMKVASFPAGARSTRPSASKEVLVALPQLPTLMLAAAQARNGAGPPAGYRMLAIAGIPRSTIHAGPSRL